LGGERVKRCRIYADFNGLDRSSRDADKLALSLHCMGTLHDLSRLKVQLAEGLEVTVYSDSAENEDLEADAQVFFDRKRSHWFAEFEENAIRYEPCPEPPPHPNFPCFECGVDLSPQVSERGLSLGDLCASCGNPIHKPISPPS
jgi:hypothetical protein